MANIPTLQNSKAAATPVLFSDAAVERAYNRISRGNVAWANAVNGAFDAASKTAYAGARLAVGVIDKIEREEDALAKATYQKRMSDFFLERQTEVLNGKAKMSNDVELGEWVQSMSNSLEGLHTSFLDDESIKPASKRLGGFLKMEFQKQMNDFVYKNFSSKYKENRVREKDAALFDLQNPDVYSNPERTAASLNLARLKGASEDELAAARTNAAFLNIGAGLDRQIAEFQNLTTEEMLKTRAERLESALSFIRDAADANKDTRLDAREQKLVDSFSDKARNAFSVSEKTKIAMQKDAVRKRFKAEEDALRKNIGRLGEVAKSRAKQQLTERLATLRTSEEGKNWVAVYFDGDFSAAESAIAQQWKETESRIASLYEVEPEKEIKAMREQQCKLYSEVLDAMLKGDPEELSRLKQITHDPDLQIKILANGSNLAPGQKNDSGETRVSSQAMVEIVNACVRAYNGENPDDLVWAIQRLRDENTFFSRSDIALVSRALAGGNKYGGDLAIYVGELRDVLAGVERRYTPRLGKTDDEKNADKHAMNAYFAGVNQLLDVLDNHDVGAGTKGTSLYDAVEPVKKQLIEAIKTGQSWDRRLELLQDFGSLLGMSIPGRAEVSNKK